MHISENKEFEISLSVRLSACLSICLSACPLVWRGARLGTGKLWGGFGEAPGGLVLEGLGWYLGGSYLEAFLGRFPVPLERRRAHAHHD